MPSIKTKIIVSEKKNEGNKIRGEISRNKENSRSLSMTHQGKYPPRGICQKTGHLEKWSTPQCQHYKKFGHMEKICCNKNQQAIFSK